MVRAVLFFGDSDGFEVGSSRIGGFGGVVSA